MGHGMGDLHFSLIKYLTFVRFSSCRRRESGRYAGIRIVFFHFQTFKIREIMQNEEKLLLNN